MNDFPPQDQMDIYLHIWKYLKIAWLEKVSTGISIRNISQVGLYAYKIARKVLKFCTPNKFF